MTEPERAGKYSDNDRVINHNRALPRW